MNKYIKTLIRGLAISLVAFLFMIPLWLFFAFWASIFSLLGVFGVVFIVLLYCFILPLQFYIIGWVAEKVIEKWVR